MLDILVNLFKSHDSTHTGLTSYFRSSPSIQAISPANRLHSAVLANDLRTVKDMIENQRISVDEIQATKTPLTVAISNGKWEIARYLVDHGANIYFHEMGKLASDDSMMPFHDLACHPDRTNAMQLLQYILDEKYGDISKSDPRGFTLLHYAIKENNRDLFDYCLTHGANVNINYHVQPKYGYGGTPLDIAASCLRYSMTEDLLKRDANPNGGILHASPAWSLAERDTPEALAIIKLLSRYAANCTSQQRQGKTPLYNAINYNAVANAQFFLSQGASLYTQDVNGASALDLFNNKLEYNRTHEVPTKDINGNINPSPEMVKLIEEWIAKSPSPQPPANKLETDEKGELRRMKSI